MLTTKDAQYSPPATGLSATPSSNAQTTARLGPGLRIKGEVTGSEDLRVEGVIEGLISLEGHRLTVGSSAHIRAEIVAREAVVSGEVTGNISARDRIEIRKGGSVVGDFTAARIVIEDGARFKGSIDMDAGERPVGSDLGKFLGRVQTTAPTAPAVSPAPL